MDKNAAAQQNHLESLSPEAKAQVLPNIAAAHKKQCKSLSPNAKAQILQKNADAHKKQQDDLGQLAAFEQQARFTSLPSRG